MDLRIFGKELTNLIEAEPKNKKSYSYIHADKLREHQNQLLKPNIHNKVNRSLDVKDEKVNVLAPLANNPQMVP